MRKNTVQIATLVLCVVLLVMNVRQGRKLERYEMDMINRFDRLETRMDRVRDSISDSVSQKLEENAKVVADFGLEPTGLNKASRSLLADVSVMLKEWRADTEVTLLAMVGENEVTLPLTGDGNGTFIGEMAFPVEGQGEICLAANVTSDGMTRREELGGWSEVSMLLPVQMHSWGGTAPVYKDGVLSVGQHDGDLEMRDGSPLRVTDTCYRLYVNGEVVIEEPECLDWIYVCAEGDEVRLALFCRDEYGLGYEFTLDEFMCDEDASDRGTGSVVSNGTVSPLLSWD